MVLDILLFTIIILVIYYCLDDVIGQFLYCCFLVGVFFNRSDFVTIPTNLSLIYDLIIAILILASLGKFYWLVKKRHSKGQLMVDGDN